MDSNPRRREYLEVGYSEDAIAIAELEYELAKDRAEDQTKLRDYLDKIKKTKDDAEDRARDFNAKTEKEANKDKDENKEDITVDPEKEKRKIASRKGKDLIQRKNELEKEIVDIRSDIERKLSQFEAKVIKSPKTINGKYIEGIKIELLEMSSALDAKENLLKAFRELGKGEDEITKVLSKESDFTKLANKINQGIADGADANSGTKKIISDLFSTIGSGATPTVSPQNIKNAKSKLNK